MNEPMHNTNSPKLVSLAAKNLQKALPEVSVESGNVLSESDKKAAATYW